MASAAPAADEVMVYDATNSPATRVALNVIAAASAALNPDCVTVNVGFAVP